MDTSARAEQGTQTDWGGVRSEPGRCRGQLTKEVVLGQGVEDAGGTDEGAHGG